MEDISLLDLKEYTIVELTVILPPCYNMCGCIKVPNSAVYAI